MVIDRSRRRWQDPKKSYSEVAKVQARSLRVLRYTDLSEFLSFLQLSEFMYTYMACVTHFCRA